MTICSHSIEETYAFAAKVAETLSGNEIIVLNGDLGAGKTTFTKGLAKALGIEAVVTSPTFTIMKTYRGGRLTLYHFDLYRIEKAEELEELGLSEYFDAGGVCVIEWNRFTRLPRKVIEISVSYGENGRVFTWEESK